MLAFVDVSAKAALPGIFVVVLPLVTEANIGRIPSRGYVIDSLNAGPCTRLVNAKEDTLTVHEEQIANRRRRHPQA